MLEDGNSSVDRVSSKCTVLLRAFSAVLLAVNVDRSRPVIAKFLQEVTTLCLYTVKIVLLALIALYI